MPAGSPRGATARAGTYAIALDGADGARTRIWDLTRSEWRGRPGVDQDGRRLARVLADRSETSQRFFASAASQWDRLREELFGRDVFFHALLGLLPATWHVADLGCGTGSTVRLLAQSVEQVIGVDGSDDMLANARVRTAGQGNVDLRRGSLEALPIDSESLDAATMMLVLHHLPAPALALAEAARVLKPGGRLLIVDMAPHEHEEYRQQMGHVWLGFSDEQMRRLMDGAGLELARIAQLPATTDAKGPALFSATATRPRLGVVPRSP